jgi:mono/diheme cytochrome c family protein
VPILDLFGGKTGAEGKDRANRRHRVFALPFVALTGLLFVSMTIRWVREPSAAPLAALHALLGFGLVPMLVLKVGIVRRWTTLQRFLPPLGMSVFAVASVVGGTGLVMAAAGRVRADAPERANRLEGESLVAEGRRIVAQSCARCHAVERVYAHSGRKTRDEWTATFDRMAGRDRSLARVRRPVLAFLHAELASDPQPPSPAEAGADAPPPVPPQGDTGDDRGRGRGRGGR